MEGLRNKFNRFFIPFAVMLPMISALLSGCGTEGEQRGFPVICGGNNPNAPLTYSYIDPNTGVKGPVEIPIKMNGFYKGPAAMRVVNGLTPYELGKYTNLPIAAPRGYGYEMEEAGFELHFATNNGATIHGDKNLGNCLTSYENADKAMNLLRTINKAFTGFFVRGLSNNANNGGN